MIFLELAAQGIRGVAPAGGRATLRPGYNVVAADGAVLRRVVEALLHPDARDGDALPRAPGGPPGAPVRAGLTVVGNDKVTYRLVRDFATGAQLHRFDADKRSFALVSQDLTEIAAFMQNTVGVPPRRRLAALLAISAAELPSKAGATGLSPSLPPQRTSLTPEQTQKRLAALRAELERAKLAEKLQYQLDGLQAQLFKLDEALKAGGKLREGLATAETARAELSAASDAAGRLGDPDATLGRFEKATARKAEAAERVAAERVALAEVEERGAPPPFWRDPLFWAGAGGGLGVALLAVLAAAVYPDARYVALLDVPMFGWAAWTGLRWVGALESWERVARRRRIVDDWERKVEAQYDKDAADVREAMKALGVSKPEDLKEAVGRIADADAVVAEWRRRLEEWEASPGARSAAGEHARVQKTLHDVEAKLSSEAGGFVRDVRSIESEIHRLETEAAAPPPAAAAPPPPPAAPAPSGDPLRSVLERAAAELGASPAAAGRAVAQKASQTLAGLSFQRLQAIVVDDRGNLQVQTGGRAVPAATLPGADKDLVWLALKLGLAEQALAAGKAVAVADDAFAGLPDGARRFAARLMKQIAKAGQIVHATSDAAFKEAADHSA